MRMRFTQLVFEGVTDGPVGLGIDVVETARRLVQAGHSKLPEGRAAPRQRVVSLDGEPVRTASGRVLPVDGALEASALGVNDVLLLPGLGLATPEAILAGLARPDLVAGAQQLTEAAARGAWVAASCSATFLLAATGLLDAREATTTWWLAPCFAQRFPAVKLRADRMVVGAKKVFTAGSAFAHADLLLVLLAHTLSPDLAHRTAKVLLLDERRSQSPYVLIDHLASADPVIRKLEAYVQANLHRQLEVADLAQATATSPRTLARRLAAALNTTPIRYLQRQRMAQAAHLLQTTTLPIDHVANQVGYADAAAFRRIFQREQGTTPTAFRSRTTA